MADQLVERCTPCSERAAVPPERNDDFEREDDENLPHQLLHLPDHLIDIAELVLTRTTKHQPTAKVVLPRAQKTISPLQPLNAALTSVRAAIEPMQSEICYTGLSLRAYLG
jgi:hypothetical protein